MHTGAPTSREFTDAIRGFPWKRWRLCADGCGGLYCASSPADIEAYERFFFEKPSMVPGIQEVNSIVALSEIKSTTCLPV